MPENIIPIKTALISVYYKTGFDDFIPRLFEIVPDIHIISSGGTAKKIREIMEKDECVQDVSAYTGFPEGLDGRVKTLHPKIHAGLLYDPEKEDHKKEYMDEIGAKPIELLVVNLYPFSETVQDPDVTSEEALEQIDIGGVALIRAGAKNHKRVTVITDPTNYFDVLTSIEKNGGLPESKRYAYACKVFRDTANYDAAINSYLTAQKNK